jgi:endonuclease/exonuclease/phosphatase family metal-dependent hydrolase
MKKLKSTIRLLFPTMRKTVARIGVAAILAWALLVGLGNSNSSIGVFATAIAPWVCALTAAWALVAFALRDWKAGVASTLLVGIMAMAFQLVPFQAPIKAVPQALKPHVITSVQVVEVNALLGTASPMALTRLVRARHADFLVIAESNDSFLNPGLIKAGMQKLLPYHYSVDPAFDPATLPGSKYASSLPALRNPIGDAIWSKWPISGERRVPGTLNPTLAIDVKIRNFPFTVVATRVQNPLLDRTEWAHDMAAIAKFVPTVPKSQHLIVAGDFNSTFGHAPFNAVLAAGLDDAQAKVNWPWARYTFPTFLKPDQPPVLPFMQIDHVLIGNGLWVNKAQTVMIPRTDHAATAVELWVTRR